MKQIKNFGTIGSILSLGAILPKIGPFLGLAGFIMVIIAIYQISKLSGQKTIFRDYLISIILGGIVPFLLASITGVSLVVGAMKGGKGFTTIAILAFIFVWVAFIISGFFLKKSFTKIAEVSGVSTFRTTGNLYFIGSILLLLFGLGGILIFTSWILQVIAFASFPQVFPKQTQPSG
jgi:uncharacterized membrane protein